MIAVCDSVESRYINDKVQTYDGKKICSVYADSKLKRYTFITIRTLYLKNHLLTDPLL